MDERRRQQERDAQAKAEEMRRIHEQMEAFKVNAPACRLFHVSATLPIASLRGTCQGILHCHGLADKPAVSCLTRQMRDAPKRSSA